MATAIRHGLIWIADRTTGMRSKPPRCRLNLSRGRPSSAARFTPLPYGYAPGQVPDHWLADSRRTRFSVRRPCCPRKTIQTCDAAARTTAFPGTKRTLTGMARNVRFQGYILVGQLWDVCFRGQSRRCAKDAPTSAFDPQRTSALQTRIWLLVRLHLEADIPRWSGTSQLRCDNASGPISPGCCRHGTSYHAYRGLGFRPVTGC